MLALKPEAEALDRKSRTIRDNLLQLKSSTVTLRATLAQRFSREFPPYENYVSNALQKASTARLSDTQLKESLTGWQVGPSFNRWTFQSEEFVSFQVLNTTKRSNVLTDYEVQTHVKGSRSGAEHDFHLQLTFGSLYTRSKLVQVDQLR
jgi:hypothetical protein